MPGLYRLAPELMDAVEGNIVEVVTPIGPGVSSPKSEECQEQVTNGNGDGGAADQR